MEPVVISTDRGRLDRDAIYRFLSEDAYWSRGVPREVVERAIENSMCFGAYRADELVGFARVVSDRATFAWLCDVFVLPKERGLGIGKRLIEAVMSAPDLRGVRNFLLATRDAHSLYARFGFQPLTEPERWMAIRRSYAVADSAP